MICEKCKKNKASVFYEENINGTVTSYSLCRECANELDKGGDLSDLFALPYLHSFGGGLLNGLFLGKEGSVANEEVCPLCNSSFSDLQKTGKAGCHECYKTFEDKLKGAIRSIHGNGEHTGRSPAKFKRSHENETKLNDLKLRLKDAISEENFELAASLRDEIRSLEKEI